MQGGAEEVTNASSSHITHLIDHSFSVSRALSDFPCTTHTHTPSLSFFPVEEEAEEVTDVSLSLILGSLVFSANEANPDYFPKNQVMF